MGQGTNSGGESLGGTATAQQAYNVDTPQWQQQLQDPKTISAIGDSISKFGSFMGAANKLPPQIGQMLQAQVGGGSADAAAGGRISGMGDIPLFSPQEAGQILRNMGISLYGNSNIQGGGAGFGVPLGTAPAAPPPMPNNPSRY